MRPTLIFPPEFDIPATTADRSILLIGRHPHCDVVLHSDSVSRRHCILAEVDEDLVIRDMGSKHGVWVNGRQVEESRLFVGDEIAIGPVIVKIVDADADADPHIPQPHGVQNPHAEPDSGDWTSEEFPTELQADDLNAQESEKSADSGFSSTEAIHPSASPPFGAEGRSESNRTKRKPAERDIHSTDEDDSPSESAVEIIL
jgi:hypothetical protein